MAVENGGETAEFAAIVETIDSNPLFDETFYEQQTGVARSRRDHIAHYVREGEAAGRRPGIGFDPAFYGAVYQDVFRNSGNFLSHYIQYGSAELRYPTRKQLQADATKVRTSRLLSSSERAKALLPSDVSDLSQLEAHLALLWPRGSYLAEGFDDYAYFKLTPAARAAGVPPMIHFIDSGLPEALAPASFSQDDYHALKAAADWDFYRRQRPDLGGGDPVLDYLTFGRWAGLAAASDFQQDYYLERYPDIRGRMEPYLHFLVHGRKEGRIGRASFDGRIEFGERPYDPERETVLIACHEASRTGAPLVGLALGDYLGTFYNVVHAFGRPGDIEAEFRRAAVAVVVGTVSALDAPVLLDELKRDYGLSAAVLNSAETFELAEGAMLADLPSVGLIHEFSEYSAGRIGRMVAAVDRGILPAQLLLESAQAEMDRDYAARANNLMVMPQGCLPRLPHNAKAEDLTQEEILSMLGDGSGARPRIVLGAGFVHIRKGLDWFVQTAAAVRKLSTERVCFAWIGHGFDPVEDHHYSLWIKDMIKRLELEETVFFFEPQGSLDLFFDLADVFMLSSRLDPFPNVVLDAFEAGRPVVCFENATGAAEWLADGRAVGAAVGYGEIDAAACAIMDLLRAGREVGLPNAELARTAFDFEAYGAHIVEQIELAKQLRATQIGIYDRLAATAAFDALFHEGSPAWGVAGEHALQRYVSRGMRGLSRLNPRPGFSDNLYKSRAGLDPATPEVALDHAIRATGDPQPTTHRCVRLRASASASARAEPFTGKIAVHLHLHYAELAAEFVERLNGAGRDIDVFVTTGAGKRRSLVDFAFAGYRRGAVQVLEVPNRGRDIGPFMTLLGEPILRGGYDLIGHFHGKKSAAVENLVPGLGDRWRGFLVDTLMGSRHELDQVLGQFALDPALGLIFAEDRNAVGWAKNRVIAEDLARRLTPHPSLPSAPFYPLGNMFWARPQAIRPLWDLGLDWFEYPAEPLPYDGTILHAVERMLPAICESTGHGWLTVYRPGRSW